MAVEFHGTEKKSWFDSGGHLWVIVEAGNKLLTFGRDELRVFRFKKEAEDAIRSRRWTDSQGKEIQVRVRRIQWDFSDAATP